MEQMKLGRTALGDIQNVPPPKKNRITKYFKAGVKENTPEGSDGTDTHKHTEETKDRQKRPKPCKECARRGEEVAHLRASLSEKTALSNRIAELEEENIRLAAQAAQNQRLAEDFSQAYEELLSQTQSSDCGGEGVYGYDQLAARLIALQAELDMAKAANQELEAIANFGTHHYILYRALVSEAQTEEQQQETGAGAQILKRPRLD